MTVHPAIAGVLDLLGQAEPDELCPHGLDLSFADEGSQPCGCDVVWTCQCGEPVAPGMDCCEGCA